MGFYLLPCMKFSENLLIESYAFPSAEKHEISDN